MWTDSEPVTVTWDVTGSGAADPTGSVSVVTNEGFRTCTATLSGTCQIRFSTPSEAAWVEVRYHGSSAFDPAVGRVSAKVLGCYNVTVSGGGRNTTAPNCAGTKFLSGTPVELVPASRAGYRFLGWSSDIDGVPYLPSPVYIRSHRFIEPRYEPICMTLRVSLRPYGLPRVPPSPAPNCDDLVALDGSIRDLDAIADQEVANGLLRYRVGTEVRLPTFSIRLDVPPDGLVSPVRWSGDGVVSNVVKMDQDREALMELDLPCQQFVADGPPGSSMRVQPSFDTSHSQLLSANPGGRCTKADGTSGYITGTSLRITMTPPSGTWFDRWGAVERLAVHRAPAAITTVKERPAGVTAGAPAVTTVKVPPHDAAISGFAAGVTCYELKIGLKDAVPAHMLAEGSAAASVDATAPTCPTWWLRENSQPTDGSERWYLPGTEVTMRASDGTRRGYVDEYADPKQIFFQRWSGDVTGELATQKITMSGNKVAVAEWYVGAACVRVVVRTSPAGAGDVVTGGIGNECPVFKSMYADVAPVPQVRLGTDLTFAARPKGTLQPIWRVEGTSVSNTEACRAREEMIAFRYEDAAEHGRTRASVERRLQEEGYLAGLVMARIQEEAVAMFAKGYTQENIVHDLKLMGLLDDDGAPMPDRLRTNPCDGALRDTVVPAGQRVISMKADGNTVLTAYFCQAVVPSVTVIGFDGSRHPATGAELNQFGPVFRSSNTPATARRMAGSSPARPPCSARRARESPATRSTGGRSTVRPSRPGRCPCRSPRTAPPTRWGSR